ncbi:hypothetical protein ACFYM0_03830 [Streptomyces sp. NPDC006487]
MRGGEGDDLLVGDSRAALLDAAGTASGGGHDRIFPVSPVEPVIAAR